jgi:uncharacterized protein with NAD-binding domain and iron-sulfur cluster
MSKRVLVLGGGVGGMSAAHELVERGFEVTVVERGNVPGGKARSVRVAGTGTGGRADLPGEHGFRFFPGFYRHLPDTMRRIPAGPNRTVFDNLVSATRVQIILAGQEMAIFPAQFPKSLEDFVDLLTGALNFSNFAGLSAEDVQAYYTKIWQLLTSCEARRVAEYEKQSWWQFVEAERHSPTYQIVFARGMTRALVAARAEEGNAKTLGDILLQLLFDISNPGGPSTDRVLNGPTNDAWIDPWLAYLKTRGVTYRLHTEVAAFRLQDRKIAGVTVEENGQRTELTGFDWYVSALPVEVMARLVTEPMVALDPKLAGIVTLGGHVRWMNGIQFYLNRDIPLEFGHQLYLDSPWALTSLSQAQFWSGVELSGFGDGTVRGILSVDVSDWDSASRRAPGKPAKACTSQEVVKEVWEQLKECLNGGSKPVGLNDADLVAAHVDESITFSKTGGEAVNREPLLVNKPDTYRIRPEADSAIENLFLAADYVRTYTDLATMEAANEAARRAVNGILARAKLPLTRNYCDVWPMYEPREVRALRALDAMRFRLDQPWSMEVPLVVRLAHQAFLLAQPVLDPVARAASWLLHRVKMPT